MEKSAVTKELPYILSRAETFTVSHTGTYEFSHPVGRSLYAFIYIAAGRVDFHFRDPQRTVSLSRGQVIYLSKGTQYSVTYLPDQAQAVLLQFDVYEPASDPLPTQPIVLAPVAQRPFRDTVDRQPGNSLQCAARIYELLALLQQQGNALPQKYRRLQPAIDQLQREPAENHPVSFYAALCHMSVPGFRRSFREHMGQSPVDFRNELRLLNARRLIEQQQYSVEAAARISGFTNLSFFYRLFRRKYGITPGHL